MCHYGSIRWFLLILSLLLLSGAQPKPTDPGTPVFLGVWDGVGVSNAYGNATFSRNASLFAAVTQKGVTLWDVSKGEELRTLPGSKRADALALSPDGRFLAARDGSALRVISVSTGKALSDAQVPGPSTNLFLLHFSPSGTYLAASEGNRARVFKVDEDGLLTRLPVPIERAGYDAAFSPDGRFLLASGVEGVHLRRVSDGSLVRRYTSSNDFSSVIFGTDNTIYLGGRKSVKHLSLKGQVLRTFTPKGYFYNHTVSLDGRLLATGGAEVQVWEVKSGKRVATLEGGPGAIYTVTFGKDASTLYAASELGTVTRYALPLGTPEFLFRAEDFRVTLDLRATYGKKFTYEVSGTFRFGDEPPLLVRGTLPTTDAPPPPPGFEMFCPFVLDIGEGSESWGSCYFQPDGSPKVEISEFTRFIFSSDEVRELAFENATESEYMESYRFVLRRR